MKTKIYIVSSTHWDREWYETFQQYRFRLVRMIDELLDILENDEQYRCFHFDGQTVLLEDYLEIRPNNRDRLSQLIKAGRILLGPWYTMPDEFLISGEGLVRNLQKGDNICKQWGVESCKSGYVCDIFGHNSQMPQIFSNFDIDNVSLFRGRSGYEDDNLLWKGADGTQSIIHKLHPDYAYSSFFFVARWFLESGSTDYDELVRRVKAYLDKEKPYITGAEHLMIDGVDHIDPEKDLSKMIKYLNEKLPDYEFTHSNYEDYTSKVRERMTSLKKVEGALYDLASEGLNNALLKNVLSSMVHLKEDNDYCESQLTFACEPLNFFLENNAEKLNKKRNGSPLSGYLDTAWKYVLQNQPHDSICGCSISAVHEDNVNRYKQAKEIISLVLKDGLLTVGENIKCNGVGKDGAFLIYNPSQTDIDGVTEVKLTIENHLHQRNFKFYDESGEEIPYNIIDCQTKYSKNSNFKKLITFSYCDTLTLAMSLKIPSYSFVTISYDILNSICTKKDYMWQYDTFNAPQRNLGSMRVSQNIIDNGKLIVEVKGNGTLKVTEKHTGKVYENLLFLEDCADMGEGWNYYKPAFDSEYSSLAKCADVAIVLDTPQLTKLRIDVAMRLPKTALGDRRSEDFEEMIVTHFVTIKKNNSQIDIKTNIDNKHTNHRLRVAFPTKLVTDKFYTLTPYDMYEWDIKKADNSRCKEIDTRVNPNQGVVLLRDKKDSFALYNKGLYEVEVKDSDERCVYLTLFRSFPNETSEMSSDMGKMLRKITDEYALDFTEDLSFSDAVKKCNLFKTGLICASVAIGDKNFAGESFVNISGNAVMSALTTADINGEKYNIIRIYDVDGGAEGKINFGKEVIKLLEIKLNNHIVKEIACGSKSIDYKLNCKEIKTFAFKFN